MALLSSLVAPSSVILANSTQIITNKTINGNNNTLTNVSLVSSVTDVLGVANGGSGSSSLTGILVGNGTSPYTSKANPTGAFVGDTDAQALTNKTISASTITENIEVIDASVTAVKSKYYILTASLVLTLPATPSVGDWVGVQNSSSTTTCGIGRNGSNIMSIASDMTVDYENVSFKLIYVDSSRGWIIA